MCEFNGARIVFETDVTQRRECERQHSQDIALDTNIPNENTPAAKINCEENMNDCKRSLSKSEVCGNVANELGTPFMEEYQIVELQQPSLRDTCDRKEQPTNVRFIEPELSACVRD